MGQALLKECSICHRPSVEKFRPFCSARCANIDLGRWLNESYVIPAEPNNPEADSELETDVSLED